MKRLLVLCTTSLLLACPPPVAGTRCDADAGGPDHEVQLRFVNLGREAVTFRLDGEDAGRQVLPLASLAKIGHLAPSNQRGVVEARNFLPDGGEEPVSLPFELDTTTGQPVTFVLQDKSPGLGSMRVTVPKQTQGATFGEKVSSSLNGVEIEGGVDTSGDCIADFGAPAGTLAQVGLYEDPPVGDCDGTMEESFVRPAKVDADATPYFIRGKNGQLQVAWISEAQSGPPTAGSALSQGASLLGGALPGGAIISSAVNRVYVLNAHSSRLPATISIDGVEAAGAVAPGALVRVKSSVVAAAARARPGSREVAKVTFVVGASTGTAEVVDSRDSDDSTLLVVSENPDSSATAMRKNKIDVIKGTANLNRVRRQVAFGTTSLLETRGCVAVLPSDDACAMGAASVGPGGGAAAASYAATGRLLYPPRSPPAQGTSMLFGVEEVSAAPQRFLWDSPAGLTPAPDKTPEGFAIVTSGAALDPTAGDKKRALFFVDTSVTPWTVQSSLSR